MLPHVITSVAQAKTVIFRAGETDENPWVFVANRVTMLAFLGKSSFHYVRLQNKPMNRQLFETA
jgi:hypothetical protein